MTAVLQLASAPGLAASLDLSAWAPKSSWGGIPDLNVFEQGKSDEVQEQESWAMKLLEENTEKSPAVQPEPVESLEEKVDREVKEGEWKVPVKFARMNQQVRTRPEPKVTYVKDEINFPILIQVTFVIQMIIELLYRCIFSG